MAWTPRRWQVWINSSTYERRKWRSMVTKARSGSTKLDWLWNFLMKLKM
jgi:hypothetical protein